MQGLVDATCIADARRRAARETPRPHSVLVADRDATIRGFLVRALVDRGFEAAGIDHRLLPGRVSGIGDRWCVVILDVSHGQAAATPLRADRDGTAVILVTADPVGADLDGDGDARPLLKPLFVRDWVALIERRCQRHARSDAPA